MDRMKVAFIAFAILGVAVLVLAADPTPRGQNAFAAIAFLAVGVVVVAIACGVHDGPGSTRGDTHQEVHIHNHPAQHQQPQYQQPAAPQIVYLPMPQPHYPPQQYAAMPPQYAPPAYPPHPQQYAPHGHHQAALQHHQAEYRGAIDVVAEPVQQQRLARGAVPQLESPQSAGLMRRMARRIVS